jgi:hypothetical protein
MINVPTRMWINQPSKHQPHHALHGTNVLAQQEHGDVMRIFFLSGDVISQQVSRAHLSEGWRPSAPASKEHPHQAEVVEVVVGLHKALSRMIDTHNADSIEAEWLGHSNELVRKLTGQDVPR